MASSNWESLLALSKFVWIISVRLFLDVKLKQYNKVPYAEKSTSFVDTLNSTIYMDTVISTNFVDKL